MQRWVGVAAVLLAFASIACASSWEPSYYDRLVGFSVAKRNSTTDTLDLLLPNSSFPFLAVEKERRVGLSGWSNWAQHLYAAQRHAAGIGVAPDKMALPFHVADLFEDGKESAKVRFHRHVVEDSTAWTVEDDEYAEPVEVSKGDFMSVWKQMEDPSHDSDAYLQVRILSWNLFLVSKLLNRQQDKRAPLFGKYVEKLGDFDAMCVSECFSPNACNVALDSLRAKGYKSITTPINKKELGGLIQNAGVYVATKHTIVAQHNLIYSDHWTMRRRKSMLNYVVKRGAVLARIRNKQGYIFSVVCTHPDYSKHNEDLDEEEIIKTSMVGNDLDSIAQEQRQRQLRELRQFVDAEVKIPETEPLIFAGDFNVDKALYANVVDSTRLFGDGADRNGETGYRFAITPSTLASIRMGVLQGRLKHYRKLLLAVYSQMYGTPHLRATMRVLEVTSAAAFGGEPFTLDPETNELVHTKKAKYLDYIFVDGLRRVAPLPFVQWTSAVKLEESDTYEVGVLGKLKNWWKGNKDPTMRDLSDHYPVMALLRFPKSKMDPPLSPRIDLDPHEADDPSMQAIGLGDWRLINRVLTRIGYAADALVMWPRAATRLQRMIANRAFEDRLVLHEDYTPCGVWRHYFRQETGHFKWIPRDPLSIFAELTRPATLPPYVEMDLRLMTYNLFMPSGIQQLTSPFVAKRERAEKLPKYIDRLGGGEPLDAICFTECFDDSLCGQGVIGKGLAELGYTSISKPVTEDKALGLVQDTGVFVASPHELVQERALAFKNTAKVGSGCWATPANCVTQRGVVWVTLRHKVSKKLFHVACASFESANVEYDYKRSRRTHDAEASARRVAQVKEMQQLLRAADVENEPLAVMFDANVNLDMVRAPSGTSTWHAWKAPMSTDPALRAGDQDAHEFLDQMFDSSVWARHEWVVWAGEQYSSNPAESKLAQRFSFMQPHASSAIVWATPSVGGSTIDFSANARRVMWVPRVRLDKKDMYHAPGFTKKLARLWRKLRGEAPSSDERWDDLSTDYPVMSRFVWVDRKMVYLHSKAQENGSFKLKLSDEEAAQFDPAVVAAGRLKFDWLAVPGTRAKVDGRATLKPEDVPTAEQWVKYRRLWHVKKHERLVQASEGSELSERSEQSEEDRALQQADEMLSLGQRRRL